MKLEADNVIPTMVEAMLPRGTRESVLHVAINIQAWAYCSEEDYDVLDDEHEGEWMAHKTVHLIFYRPQNYTLVLQSVSRGPSIMCDMEWKRMSYHDSGWRSDGLSELDGLAASVMDDVKAQIAKDFGDAEVSALPLPRLTCRIDEVKLFGLDSDLSFDHRGMYGIDRGTDGTLKIIAIGESR